MKSLKSRLWRQEAPAAASPSSPTSVTGSTHPTEWSKYDDRLMKAAERGDVEKVSSILAKKGVHPGKLDVEGRSAFHVVASKGNLECLNAILIHGIDVATSDSAVPICNYCVSGTALDTGGWRHTRTELLPSGICRTHFFLLPSEFWGTGRNALHLAAKYGHALCLQKLLQYNCPTEHMDLQGRTALHDAAMAGCPSSIQLLCDHGASVNAKDVDGRTPLVLATQMCRPMACQLLIDRGADVNSRDKQNRTALMLGCEYGCRDAVEVLVKNGANVTLLDALGHDSSYYARIGDNLDILNLLKTASENTNKGRELWKKGPSLQQDEGNMKSNQREHHSFQDLEIENEDLREKLRKIQQEQRILLDKVNGLQLQLNEEVMVADDLEMEREKLKSLLAAKEKQHEESLRTIEALKNRFKYFESEHLGPGGYSSNRKEDMLHKQGQVYTTDSQCTSPGVPTHQSRSMLRPLELSLPSQTSYSEIEIVKKELEEMRTLCDAAKQDRLKLQNELAHKVAECNALTLERERVKEDSDEQIRQLEDALKDVQKRMYESEGKVKQMQTHFLALKEHLTSEAATGSHRVTEELKDMKAKYEGASAEVGKLRNQIKQSEMLVEEFKRDESRLMEENRRLQRECSTYEMEREKKGRRVVELEGQLKELAAKLALSIPTEKFDSMKSLLSSEVNEKAKRLAEVGRDYANSLEEIRQLRRDLESVRAKLAQHVRPEEHEQLRSRLEQKSGELGKKVAELTLKNQTLQKEVEKVQGDNQLLGQQVHSLTAEMKTHYVPLKVSEELKKAHAASLEDLNRRLSDATQRYAEKRLEAERLLAENDRLTKSLGRLEAVFVAPEKHEEELTSLKSNIAELKKQLSELNKKCGEDQEKLRALTSENAGLKKTLSSQYVPVKTHEEVKASLSSTVEKTNRALLDAKKRFDDTSQEFSKLRDENEVLRRNLENLQNQMKADYVSLEEHSRRVSALSQSLKEAQEANAAVLADHRRGQEEIGVLHAEIKAQKKELDTIQECIKLKYAPLARLEECERKFKAAEKALKEQLSEQTHKCRVRDEEAKKGKQENERLRRELTALQKELKERSVLVQEAREAQRELSGKTEELNKQLTDLSQKYATVKSEKEKLAEEKARQTSEVLAAQNLLQRQPVPLEQVEVMKKSLNDTIEQLKEELRSKQRCVEREQQTVSKLQQLLENQKNSSVPLADHLQLKEALEKEVTITKASLREKEEESQIKTKEVSKLQTEVQNTKQALKNLETREVVDLSKYKATKSDLEAQISNLNDRLASLNRKYHQVCEEKLSAKDEKELLHLSIEQEIKDQKERCDKSLTTVMELQQRIQESAKQIEAKDNKITELLSDVERLKQALNGLSQLTYSGSPTKRQSQLVDTLQHRVRDLQQQLADADRQHQEVIAIYRTHLLSAAQGHMDEDVQAALLQIIQMRQGLVC
ncbi:uveal autoantigen with coiled-coil domains and ankyrin repeats isoform X2 [Meriones unguiculatus]|uniref:uveal autoantigen with coiled-coil domains and ankyrin repeats isoform X2 n=1 Tax=Meriones unguiculatus TaxID=10047 RepID=UPI00293F1B70|nr:uveal autoantigen with coiled-coil domains and ankyrin repeats isoform X2 [Meriones unguiculatus]